MKLKKKIREGKKSLADLKSDLFLKYIKDKCNLIENYNDKIENVIEVRKSGIEDNKFSFNSFKRRGSFNIESLTSNSVTENNNNKNFSTIERVRSSKSNRKINYNNLLNNSRQMK